MFSVHYHSRSSVQTSQYAPDTTRPFGDYKGHFQFCSEQCNCRIHRAASLCTFYFVDIFEVLSRGKFSLKCCFSVVRFKRNCCQVNENLLFLSVQNVLIVIAPVFIVFCSGHRLIVCCCFFLPINRSYNAVPFRSVSELLFLVHICMQRTVYLCCFNIRAAE